MRPDKALFASMIALLLLLNIQAQNQLLLAIFFLQELMNEQAVILNALVLREQRRRRRQRRRRPYLWTLPRPAESWFEVQFYDHTLPDDFFKQQVRMGRNTFHMLLNVVARRLTRQNTHFRRCIEPEKVLAIGLFRLAHGNSYISIAPAMNVGKSTVIEAVQDVVEALYEMRNEFIKFPETMVETASTIRSFEHLSALPNIAGAIDGTHIRISAPKESAVDYFSRYQQHDFIIQAVVDGSTLFTDFSAGFPGSMHDARVLRNTTLFRRAEQREILTGPLVDIGCNQIGPYLVGDSAYPLCPWLLKPFPEATRNPREIAFNKELSSARVKVECAFGVLKSRWRILQKRLDSDIQFATKIAISCAVLHNFCIKAGDVWDEDDRDDHYYPGDAQCNDIIRDGEDIRVVLQDYIANN